LHAWTPLENICCGTWTAADRVEAHISAFPAGNFSKSHNQTKIANDDAALHAGRPFGSAAFVRRVEFLRAALSSTR
jgi:hypothetical protein